MVTMVHNLHISIDTKFYISLNAGYIKLKKYTFQVGDAFLDELCVIQSRRT
jgi:hypothetical protein